MTIQTVEDFYSDSATVIGLFNAFVEKHALQDTVKADHICYKCGSVESFERIRTLLEQASEYVYQSIISNRRIAYIKLKTPVDTLLGQMYFVELSDPKPDGSQRDGFDHIEAYPVAFSYDELVQRLGETERVVHVERPHHTTDDVDVGEGFLFRCTQGPLIDKIKGSEMS